jgi:hypothetical protein
VIFLKEEKFYLEIDDTFDFGKEPMPIVTQEDKEKYDELLEYGRKLLREHTRKEE